jgi:acetoacetyl-CoA reductase
VAANYAGNDEAANKFKAETGIPVYKWSVAEYEACAAGIRQVEAEVGPVRYPGQQRRHHARRHVSTA